MSQTTSNQPTYIGRFAPSPTGLLHLGSLTAALGSFLDAKANDGEWLLRIEDIDPPREYKGAKDIIPHQLEQHGLEWDGEVCFQSTRTDTYQEYFYDLIKQDVVYPCNCSRRKIREMGAIYNRHCLRNPPNEETDAAFRLKTIGSCAWHDLVQGPTELSSNDLGGDFVVRRKDGFFSYQLAVAVDDHLQGITRVVRGADLLDSTARQIHIMQTLGWSPPEYAHLPMVLGRDGHKLSKQTHAPVLDPDKVIENLYQALQVLGLAPPKEVLSANREDLIQWAISFWNLSAVPQTVRPDSLC